MNEFVTSKEKGKKIIYLIKIGDLEDSIISTLKMNLELKLKDYIDAVHILPDFFPIPKSSYDPKRKQYLASLILDELSLLFNSNSYFYIIGVMNQDIYIIFNKQRS